MPDPKRTEFAMKALSLVDLFKIQVGAHEAGDALKYRVELSSPEGPSTGGGTQSVQHVSLLPTSGPALVAGSANQVEGSAELRTYEYVAWTYAQRFKGTAPALSQASYDEVLERLKTFFINQGLRVHIIQKPAAPSPSAQTSTAKSSVSPAVIALALLVAVLAIIAIILINK